MSKLQRFAELKRLPIEFLTRLEVQDDGGKIRFGNGGARARFREKPETAKGNFLWSNDEKMKRTYGYERVEEMAKQSATILVVEGESDALTAWFHRRPALGIPGATMTNIIERSDVARFDRVVVIREHDEDRKPDQGGKVFPGNVAVRLRKLRYEGVVVVADLPGKDLSVLHVQYADDAEAFDSILDAAIEAAKPISTDAQSIGARTDAPRIVAIDAADIERKPVEWISRGYVPAGHITLIDGDGDTGKSTLMRTWVAGLSAGRDILTGRDVPPRVVAFVGAEDSLSPTVESLRAGGADLSRVKFLTGVRHGEDWEPITFPAHIGELERYVAEVGATVVYIDALFSHVCMEGSGTMSHEVRACAMRLREFCERTGVALVAVRHWQKAKGEARSRALGSIEWSNVARSCGSIAIHPENPERRVFAMHKANLAYPRPGTISYAIASHIVTDEHGDPVLDSEGIPWSVGYAVDIQPESDISADDVAMRAAADPDERSVAEEFLLSTLREPMSGAEVAALADKQRIPRRTLQRTAKKLGVAIERRGFAGGTVWSPPESGPAIAPPEDHSRQSRLIPEAGANGTNEPRTGTLSARGKLCRACNTINLGLEQDDGTYLCQTCTERVA